MEKAKTAIIVVLMCIITGITSIYIYKKYDKANEDIKKDSEKRTENNTQKGNNTVTPSNNNSGSTETEKVVVTPTESVVTLNVEVKNNRFYVNGNMVDFYTPSEVRANNNVHSEDEFYCNGTEKTGYRYEQVGDVLFVQVEPCNTIYITENYFVDATGKILKKVNGYLPDITLSTTDPFIEIAKITDNSIYLIVRDTGIILGSEQPVCDRIAAGKQEDIARYVDKITYENGEFTVEYAVDKTTFAQYRVIRKINCPDVVADYGNSKAVEGTTDEVAAIKDNKLLILNDKNEVLSELATLDSNNYEIYSAKFINTDDKLCKVSNAGTYIFLSKRVTNGNGEKVYAIYYNGKYGTHSELTEQDATGAFGNLVSCK